MASKRFGFKIYKLKNKEGHIIYNLEENNLEKINLKRVEKAYSKILSGIQVSWAEESIKRLFYEDNLFTNNQRNYLLSTNALDQKWYKALDLVFCIAYDILPPTNDCDASKRIIIAQRRNLGDELIKQYLNLRSIITKYLVPNFSIRNKVQHGEWVYAFKPPISDEFSLDITNKLNHENLITTTSRFTLVNAFYQMIVDMGRFKSNSFAIDSMLTPFEYFYPDYIRKIKYEVNKIENPNLEKFIEELIKKEIRGEAYRKNH